MKTEFRSIRFELLRLALQTAIVSVFLFTKLLIVIIWAEVGVAFLLVEIMSEFTAKIIAFILLPLIIGSLISYILLKPTVLWLCSIPVQLAVYSLLWWLQMGGGSWNAYAEKILFIFAVQAIGVGIRLISRLVIRLKKRRGEKKLIE